MAANLVTAPFMTFNDIDGNPLDGGYIYVGEENLDPIANPVNAFWDSALTVPALQPIRTINGYPARNGSAGNLYVAEAAFSLLVKSQSNTTVFSVASQTAIGGGAAASDIYANVADYGAVGDGVTDDSAAIQACIDDLFNNGRGGNMVFPTGNYLIASSITARSRIQWVGQGRENYGSNPGIAPVVLLRHPDLDKMILQNGGAWGMTNIELNGNSGTDGDTTSRPTYGIAKASGGLTAGCTIDNCTFINLWYGIGDGTNAGAFKLINSQFAGCRTAVQNIADSRINQCNFRGCKFAAISLNTGGVHITGNLIEFNRTGTNGDELAHGIFLQSNANEIQIDDNRFDRNAGQDVYIVDGAKRPRDISMVGNHFMRASWGEDDTLRSALYIKGADRVTVVGNIFYAANSNPSTVRGRISPRYAAYVKDCTGLNFRGNSYVNLANKIPLETSTGNQFGLAPVWIESSSGTDEWYLTDLYDPEGNPWTGLFNSIVLDGKTVITSGGTAGSLATNEWAWADNDSLGFNTIYCRLAVGGNPGSQSLIGYHDGAPVKSTLNDSGVSPACTDFQTDEFRDARRLFVTARKGTAEVPLMFRQRCMTNHVTNAVLNLAVDQATTTDNAFAELPFLIRRTTTSVLPTIPKGTIDVRETGLNFQWEVYPPLATEESVTIVSSSAQDSAAGTGMRTATVWGTNDTDTVISESVNMNGTTPVALTAPFNRISQIIGDTFGGGAASAGDVTMTSVGTAATMIVMASGRTQTVNAVTVSVYANMLGDTTYWRFYNDTPYQIELTATLPW